LSDGLRSAAYGSKLGAAGGAILGAVTPVGPLGGALIGGAGGGATGVLTEPSQVNLGKPVWRSSSASAEPVRTGMDPNMVREVQADLRRHGYDVGPADGRLGPRTQAAIRQYEQLNGLPVDGMPSGALLEHLQSHLTG
jgi:peptidoglycan hydrolase-like protein with peptidoglycan-binding domain